MQKKAPSVAEEEEKAASGTAVADKPAVGDEPAGAKLPLVYPDMVIPFALLILCFIAWGVAQDLTAPMVAAFKGIFTMSTLQASLVQFAYFGAYFLLALPAAWAASWGSTGFRQAVSTLKASMQSEHTCAAASFFGWYGRGCSRVRPSWCSHSLTVLWCTSTPNRRTISVRRSTQRHRTTLSRSGSGPATTRAFSSWFWIAGSSVVFMAAITSR